MGMLARLGTGAAVLAAALFVLPVSPSFAADGGLGLEIKTAQPTYGSGETVRLTFAVTNASAAACKLTKAAEGSVLITSVRRDGQEIAPQLSRSFYENGIGSASKAGLVDAAPQAAVDVQVAAVPSGTDVVLRSVAAMPDGSGLDTLWPIGAVGRYEVTAAYAAPDLNGACTGISEARTVTFTVGESSGGLRGIPWLWVIVGGAVVLLACALLLILMLRRRHRAAAAVALLILVVLGFATTTPKPAYADFEVNPNTGVPVPGVDFQKAVDGCMAGFAAPGGDPAGILPRLKNKKTPKVTIIPTTGGSGAFETSESKDGKGSSTITWNPTNTDDYEAGVPRDPCAALYHELNHSDDISKNTVPQGECGDTGIKTAEVKATMAENRYRKAKGLPARTEYQDKKLPKSMDECKKPKKKTPPPKGPVRLCENSNPCGSTNGDPHLVTFDKAYYDFQAVGEFVVVRSTAGDPLEVQARQAPLGDSRLVAVNSAVAFRTGTHKVELTIVKGRTEVRVDGTVTQMSLGEKALPGGGTFTTRESDIGLTNGYDLRWPDGSEAAVDQIGHYGFRLLLKLDRTRAGKVVGLLGNFDGDPTNDIAPSGGAPLAQPLDFAKVYPSYADSWRVAQKDSLFAYAAGQSTDTFTDRTFPDKPVTIKDLTETQRVRAEETCRWAGITDAWQYAECVLDVGASGRPEFAVSGATSELIAPPVATPIATPPIASGTLQAGGTNRLTFTGHAGQAVFVDAIAPTVVDQCSPYRLLDPAGKDIASGCNISGQGFIDRTDLTVDGQYTVVLSPREDIGRATIRVYAATDTTATVEPNGAVQSATLEQPGAQARYRFTGTTGQRVFVDIPDSSLPDQCSPLELRDPSGRFLSSGCVINGSGDIEGTLLTQDGTYTVIVDPRDRTIGAIRLQVFAAKDKTSTITLGGQAVMATVDQPGLVARYTFTGAAGQHVVIDASDSSLPDQCSPLELRDSADRFISSGCIINGVGGLETTLPSTGGYTVIVDPRGSATGTVTLTLR